MATYNKINCECGNREIFVFLLIPINIQKEKKIQLI